MRSPPADDAAWPEDHEGQRTMVVPPDRKCEGKAPLAARLAEEMARAWRRGERLTVETFLDLYPDTRGHPEVVLRLICEEVCLRQEAGQTPEAEELARRFPELRVEIGNLLDV